MLNKCTGNKWVNVSHILLDPPHNRVVGVGAMIFLILLVKRPLRIINNLPEVPKQGSSGRAGVQVWVCLTPEPGFLFSITAVCHVFDGIEVHVLC